MTDLSINGWLTHTLHHKRGKGAQKGVFSFLLTFWLSKNRICQMTLATATRIIVLDSSTLPCQYSRSSSRCGQDDSQTPSCSHKDNSWAGYGIILSLQVTRRWAILLVQCLGLKDATLQAFSATPREPTDRGCSHDHDWEDIIHRGVGCIIYH